MALININKLKEAAGKALKDATDWTQQAAKDASDWTAQAAKDASDWTAQAAKDAGDWTRQATKTVGDSATDFATGIIVKLLKGLDLDGFMKNIDDYHVQTGKDVQATKAFINKLIDLRDGK